MKGFDGNDTYVVDHADDEITENADEGTDTVESTIDYVLGDDLGDLELQGKAIKGTGNDLDNIIIGNDEANVSMVQAVSIRYRAAAATIPTSSTMPMIESTKVTARARIRSSQAKVIRLPKGSMWRSSSLLAPTAST